MKYQGELFELGDKKAVTTKLKEIFEKSEDAVKKHLDGLVEAAKLDRYINSQDFKFLKLGYRFKHTFKIAKDGSKEIFHYLLDKEGRELWQGLSTISEEGVVFNIFEVTIQQQEVSTAIYKLLDKIGFKKIEGSYGSGSLGTNFQEFMKVYVVTNDAVKAAYATPAGKALNKALDNRFKTTKIKVTKNKVKLY